MVDIVSLRSWKRVYVINLAKHLNFRKLYLV